MAGLRFQVPEWSSCLRFGPHQHQKSLLAIGGKNLLTIKECILNESEIDDVKDLTEILSINDVTVAKCNVGGRIKLLSWSPQSAITDNEHFIRIAIVGSDNIIYLFCSDALEKSIIPIGTHVSDINSIAFHPIEPNTLASVGDDMTCKIWNIETCEVLSEFQLMSSGMYVSFHPQQCSQILVTESIGRIRLYNLDTQSPILSLDCLDGTLLQSDWSVTNSMKVGGVGNSSWYVWDISQSSLPYDTQIVPNNAQLTNFKWCSVTDSVFATSGIKGSLQIRHYEHQNIPVSCTLPVIKDICWHPTLPITLACTNNELVCYSINL